MCWVLMKGMLTGKYCNSITKTFPCNGYKSENAKRCKFHVPLMTSYTVYSRKLIIVYCKYNNICLVQCLDQFNLQEISERRHGLITCKVK